MFYLLGEKGGFFVEFMGILYFCELKQDMYSLTLLICRKNFFSSCFLLSCW